MKWTDKNIVAAIRRGDDKALVHLYTSHKSEFLAWMQQRMQADPDLATDLYQEAILVLRQNVVIGKYVETNSSLKTYLFSIGKHMLYNHRRKQDKVVMMEKPAEGIYIVEDRELSDRQAAIKQAVLQTNEPCLSILKMYYYLGFSMQVIAERMAYKSPDVAKSQKARCIKQLKEKLMK